MHSLPIFAPKIILIKQLYASCHSLNIFFLDKRIGEWLFKVEEAEGEAEARVQCIQWAATQNQAHYELFNTVVHCPSSVLQVWTDPA